MKHRHIVIMLGIVVIAVLRASGLAWADESEHYAAAQKEIVFFAGYQRIHGRPG